MPELMQVAVGDQPVGQISYASHDERFGFVYDDAWRAKKKSFPLSPHFPLDGEAARPATVQRFLANLLPEGRALDVAAGASQLSKDNIFGLVRVLGTEPVGALSFYPAAADKAPGQGLVQARLPVRRLITHEELSERIRDRDSMPFPVWDRRVRLSVAGYQDKLQVLLEGEQLSFAEGALASTHILKPDSRNAGTPHMVANEHFCMRLAARLGLPVAPVSIRRIPEPILLIERFDRQVVLDRETGKACAVRRLHVIDACQALDVPVSYKYERNYGNGADVRHVRDGVSFEQLFSLEKFMENPARGRADMVRWALFQLLIGNSDAHGKNMSFFVGGAGITPAPSYDLVSVNAYGEGVEQEMAMGFGDVFDLAGITPYALADFAHRTGTPARYLSRELTRMAKDAPAIAAELARADLYAGDERAVVNDIARFVTGQAALLLGIAPEIAKVPKDLFT